MLLGAAEGRLSLCCRADLPREPSNPTREGSNDFNTIYSFAYVTTVIIGNSMSIRTEGDSGIHTASLTPTTIEKGSITLSSCVLGRSWTNQPSHLGVVGFNLLTCGCSGKVWLLSKVGCWCPGARRPATEPGETPVAASSATRQHHSLT